ncbi:hypothetical protein H1235_02100 [Pseudoxanthomonas sp. NC8]|nr:hypothetical protein H1235_02100 [Pseudoxanthomonas sp. NC8]
MNVVLRPSAAITTLVMSFITGSFQAICSLFFTLCSRSPADALPSMNRAVEIFCLISASSSWLMSSESVTIMARPLCAYCL